MASGLANLYGMVRADFKTHLPNDLRRAHDYFVTSLTRMAKEGQAKLQRAFSGIQSQVYQITAGILAAGGIRGLATSFADLSKSVFEASNQFEQYQVSLGVLLKSKAEAKKFIFEVERMASETPFTTSSLMRSLVQLKTFGFQTKELIPMMRIIGDAAAASPEGMESGIHRISYALGQMRTAGRVMAQDVNQLTQAGIPVWEMLAEKLGVSIRKVKELSETGQITGERGVQIILEGMQKRFGGMMEEQSKTFGGMMSTIKDNAQIAMRDIGAEIFAMSKNGLRAMIDWMASPAFKKAIDNVKSWIHSIIETVKKLVNDPLVQGIAKFAALTVGVRLTAKAIGVAVSSFKAMFAVLSPLNLLIGAMALAFHNALNSHYGERLTAALTEIKELVTFIFRRIIEGVAGLNSGLDDADGKLASFKDTAASAFTVAIEKIRDVVKWIAVLSADWDAAWDWIKDKTLSTFTTIKSETVRLFKELAAIVWGGMSSLWTLISEVVSRIGDALLNIIPAIGKGLWEGLKNELTGNGPTGADAITNELRKWAEEQKALFTSDELPGRVTGAFNSGRKKARAALELDAGEAAPAQRTPGVADVAAALSRTVRGIIAALSQGLPMKGDLARITALRKIQHETKQPSAPTLIGERIEQIQRRNRTPGQIVGAIKDFTGVAGGALSGFTSGVLGPIGSRIGASVRNIISPTDQQRREMQLDNELQKQREANERQSRIDKELASIKSIWDGLKQAGPKIWDGAKNLFWGPQEGKAAAGEDPKKNAKAQFVKLDDLSKRIQENLTKKDKKDKHADANAENLKKGAENQKKAADLLGDIKKLLPFGAKAGK